MQYQSFSPRRLTVAFICIAFVTLLLALPQASQTAAHTFGLAPPPNWISGEAVTQASAEQRNEARDGVVFLLSDQQVRVNGNTVERYFHRIHQVITQPGIEHVSQLELEFDPSYQQLIIHRIQIKRGAQTINALRPTEIRLLQKEDEMEQRLFNGTLAALVILNDVRVGDVVDYDYSVNGANPILGRRFADENYLAEAEPVVRLRYRLLWPAGRTLHHQTRDLELSPTMKDLGEVTEYTWERHNAPAPELEPEASGAAKDVPTLQLSEFKNWAEVAAWAVPLYRVAPSPALQRQLESWRQAAPEPEGQLLAALRFVQDEIRYLGIEMGPHSHLPHPPAQVLERRYGDCKDKALLLSTALNAFGIEAYPALVNSDLLGRVKGLLPSPFSFDHVITQVRLKGKTYWFDPTMSLQRGGLAQHYNPEFGHALVVRAGAIGLEEIPLAPTTKPLKLVKELYTVDDDNRAATLEVATTYRSIDADAMRDYLAKNTLKDLARERLQSLHARDRSIIANGKPQVQDDTAANAITITERYQIARFWRDGARSLVADRITQELPFIKTETQRPVHLTYPLDVEHRIEIRAPRVLSLKEGESHLTNEALQFDARREHQGRTLKFTYRLRTLRPYVNASAAAKLANDLERIEDLSNLYLTNQSPVVGAWQSGWLLLGGLLLLLVPFMVFLVIKALQAKRRLALPVTRTVIALPGSEPSIPLRLGGEAALVERLLALRCECGRGYPVPPQGWERAGMFYDGKRLELLLLHCTACERGRDVYCELAASQVISSTGIVEESGYAD